MNKLLTESKNEIDSKISETDIRQNTRQLSNPKLIFSNIISLMLSEVVVSGITFVGVGIIARKVGAEGFGIVAFAGVIFFYLSFLISYGFNDVSTREIAHRPQDAVKIGFNVILVKLILATIIFAGFSSVVWLLEIREPLKSIILLTNLSIFTLAIDTSWLYRGLERNKLVSVAQILGKILYLGIILFVVDDFDDLIYVPIAQILGELFVALVLFVPFYRLGKIEFHFATGLKILRDSLLWTVSRLFRILNNTFDIVLIGLILGEKSVGLYNAPYRICILLTALVAAIHISYLPTITRALRENAEQAGFVTDRSIYFAVSIIAPIIVGGIILAAPLLQLVFGAEYAESANIFRLMLISTGLIFIHGAIHNLMLALNRTKTEMIVFAVVAVINISLNLIIIPRYGLIGAALITILSEGLTLLMGFLVLKRDGIHLKLFRLILRPLIASFVMGATLLIFGSGEKVWLEIILGFVCYVVLLTIIGGVPVDIKTFFKAENSAK